MSKLHLENHFGDLFETTSDLIHFLKIDGTIEKVNPAWLATLGYEFSEVAGRSIYEFIHPDFIAAYQRTRAKVISRHVVNEVETAFITRNNRTIIGDGRLECAYNDGEPIYTRCVFRNMTERKEAEREIEESQMRLQAFFASAPDAVIVIDQFQKILEWNPKAESIFGFTKSEIVGKTLAETIIPHQYREAHISGMQHFLKTGEENVLNKTIEITALHKTGKEFPINLSISKVQVNSRWLFIAFLSDISERKKTEEALIRKEAELMQSKLLEERKNEFISVAGHELKTPITTIKAFTQVALTMCDDCPPDVVTYLIKMDQNATKLNFLLNELLDVSKIQHGELLLAETETKMHEFLPEILNSIQHITHTHEIILDKNAEAVVSIDLIRLEQVIVNLVSNAAKYSPGEERIIVKSIVQNGEIIISVKDTGIGISPENIGKIFNRYYRVHKAVTQFSGLGIGLFVSSNIIKKHSGRIWAESTLGEGSTFNFSLPVLVNNGY